MSGAVHCPDIYAHGKRVDPVFKDAKKVCLNAIAVLLTSLALIAINGCQPATIKPVVSLSSGTATHQRVLHDMLSQAEAALALDQLTTPKHDNAYDRFQGALLLDPDNQQAQSGLQLVLMRYVELASAAYGASDVNKAEQHIAKAESLDPSNPLVLELQQRLRDMEQAERETVSDVNLTVDTDIVLPPNALTAQSDALIELLSEVAQRMAVSHETVLIQARNDAEGRWIYQQMRYAMPGYRLRGDIKIAETAKLKLLPPID